MIAPKTSMRLAGRSLVVLGLLLSSACIVTSPLGSLPGSLQPSSPAQGGPAPAQAPAGPAPAGATATSRAPVISAFDYSPKTGVTKNDAISFTLVVLDNSGNPLQYSWTSTKGRLSSNVGQTVSWHPMKADGTIDPGLSTVSVVISNGALTSTGSVNIMIDERGNASVQGGSGVTPPPPPQVTQAPPPPPPPTADQPVGKAIDPTDFIAPPVDPNRPQKLTPITVNTTKVKVQFRDDVIEDGDRIRISLNGKVVKGLEDLTLTNAGQIFELEMVKGDNTITVTALNEGRLEPNTTEVNVHPTQVTRGSPSQLSKGLKTGESESLIVTVP